MDSRRLEITIVSAENLPDIRRIGRMKVYAEISLNGVTKSTSTDRYGNTSPRWDFPFVYTVNEAYLHRPGLDVVVDLYCERTLGDKHIGRVVIPVKSLFDKGIKSQRSLSYPIAGTSYGRLYIRYCFEEKLPPPPPAAALAGPAAVAPKRNVPRGWDELEREISRIWIRVDFD